MYLYVYVHKSDNPANNSEDPRNTKSTCHQTHIPIHRQAQLCTLRSRHANQMPPAIQRVLTKRIKISQGRACMYSNSRSWPILGTAKSSSQILGSSSHPSLSPYFMLPLNPFLLLTPKNKHKS